MKVPCEQCISFAICNVQIKEMKEPDVTQFSMKMNCDNLKGYIRLGVKGDHATYNRVEIANARKLFGLGRVIPGEEAWRLKYESTM